MDTTFNTNGFIPAYKVIPKCGPEPNTFYTFKESGNRFLRRKFRIPPFWKRHIIIKKSIRKLISIYAHIYLWEGYRMGLYEQ